MSNLLKKVRQKSSGPFQGSQQYTGRPASQGGSAGGTIPNAPRGGPGNRRGRSGGVRTPLGAGGGY